MSRGMNNLIISLMDVDFLQIESILNVQPRGAELIKTPVENISFLFLTHGVTPLPSFFPIKAFAFIQKAAKNTWLST